MERKRWTGASSVITKWWLSGGQKTLAAAKSSVSRDFEPVRQFRTERDAPAGSHKKQVRQLGCKQAQFKRAGGTGAASTRRISASELKRTGKGCRPCGARSPRCACESRLGGAGLNEPEPARGQ